jgi:hypothetical protein
MIGDERVRFCGQCNLNVYNLSAMNKGDAERLISQTEGRLCIRYYRRADGTILTNNCPVGLRTLKRRMSRIASASAAAIVSFLGGLFAVTGLRERPLIPVAAQGAISIKVNERLPEPQPVMGTYPVKPDYIKEQSEIIRDDFASVAGRMRVVGRKR